MIPVYNEDRVLDVAYDLLKADVINQSVEVIFIVNDGEDSSELIKKKNQVTLGALNDFCKTHASKEKMFLVYYAKELPNKHAGVGLARKIGMDEALRRLNLVDNPNGIIVCLDADCRIWPNYLTAISNHFEKQTHCNAANIHFAHETSNEAIILYELFLRYYINCQRYSGHPNAYHTIGSCMAVRASIYAMEGGMNRKKAGEDFYFLHKIIPRGHFQEISDTTIIPSNRPSDRVPFGTGRAILNYNAQPDTLSKTYAFETFIALKSWMQRTLGWYDIRHDEQRIRFEYSKWPLPLKDFIVEDDFVWQINEAKINSSSQKTFDKRIFQWFDAFKLLKFVHHARDKFYENAPILSQCQKLLEAIGDKRIPSNTHDMLLYFRELDKKGVLLNNMRQI